MPADRSDHVSLDEDRGLELTVRAEHGDVRRADRMRREVCVGEDDLVAMAHLRQDLQEIRRDDG